jgi:hypothetical protein
MVIMIIERGTGNNFSTSFYVRGVRFPRDTGVNLPVNRRQSFHKMRR